MKNYDPVLSLLPQEFLDSFWSNEEIKVNPEDIKKLPTNVLISLANSINLQFEMQHKENSN